jgi:hypothetical protein
MHYSIVASPIVAEDNDERYAMTNGGKGTRVLKIGRHKMYKVRTEFDKEGEKRRRKG